MFRANSFVDVLKHLAFMGVLIALMVLGFFYLYLPNTTNHGETISVPKIVDMQLQEAEDYLESQNLRYFINDSTYKPDLPLTCTIIIYISIPSAFFMLLFLNFRA